ncbi:carboxypeptidase-like regulatory domain-containing protein [Ichthyenterobacterium magnum]|uniref:Carboxypeptidase family protein n=1 Tax=Ichthyenterobacterium magnum TaxID=1230530 RepID=A0A420DFE3_9FLAO|nr:carboxypeptidase-like regulatory domain-containing protein [Ichthyenterobacterium magnum]RKE91940.1 hypothetical protein BXY80_2370 [Ichthyenterobacterium magnum]
MNPNQRFTKAFFIFLFLTLTLSSCNNDDSPTNENNNQEPNPTAFAQNFGSNINRNFLGTVIDSNHNPIENVTITIGNSIATTDTNGIFIINNASVNQRFAYVKAEKVGYIHGSRALVPSTGINKVSIMLLEEIVAGTTSSGTPETIALPNGASVSLEGDYIKENGTVYSGNVNVIMHHLDPVNENMNAQMPGMLYAANSQNEERMLQTFGMLAIELRGDSGEDLNLAEGSAAEIKVPLDASLITNAPTTIPLWYFDEVNGYWIEDGQATLVGNTYIGTVTHFSFWNCDIPAETANLCVTVNDEFGNTINNLNVSIASSTYGTRGGYTNENGEVCGLVPSGETLELNVYNYDICGNTAIYTSSIGPFNEDSNISIIVLDSPDIITETVTGVFNTCNGNPVTGGYVQLTYANQTFTDVVTDGSFEINLIRCANDNTFKIKGSDYINLQSTDSISYTFTTPSTNIGAITSCNSITEFIQYTIDDTETVFIFDFIEANFYSGTGQTGNFDLNISAQSDVNCFYLTGNLNDAPYVGTYNHLDWNNVNDTGLNIVECLSMSNTNNNIIYNLTSIGNVGEYIDINFSGSYEDFNGNSHTITGIIHVIRDY